MSVTAVVCPFSIYHLSVISEIFSLNLRLLLHPLYRLGLIFLEISSCEKGLLPSHCPQVLAQ